VGDNPSPKLGGLAQTLWLIVLDYLCGVPGGIEVPVYIQKDKYTGAFELKVDNKVQYGQKNKEGENRFAVYHDTSRKPFQVRSIWDFLSIKGAFW
jgi:hypothetical protein